MPKIIINEYLYIEYTCNNGIITVIDAPNVDPKSYSFRKDGTFIFSGKRIGTVDTKTGNYTEFKKPSSSNKKVNASFIATTTEGKNYSSHKKDIDDQVYKKNIRRFRRVPVIPEIVDTKRELHTHFMEVLSGKELLEFIENNGVKYIFVDKSTEEIATLNEDEYTYIINQINNAMINGQKYEDPKYDIIPLEEAKNDSKIISQLQAPSDRQVDFKYLSKGLNVRHGLVNYAVYEYKLKKDITETKEARIEIYYKLLDRCLDILEEQDVEYVEFSYSNAGVMEGIINKARSENNSSNSEGKSRKIEYKFLLASSRNKSEKEYRDNSDSLVDLLPNYPEIAGFDLMSMEAQITSEDKVDNGEICDTLHSKLKYTITRMLAGSTNSTPKPILRLHAGEMINTTNNPNLTLEILSNIEEEIRKEYKTIDGYIDDYLHGRTKPLPPAKLKELNEYYEFIVKAKKEKADKIKELEEECKRDIEEKRIETLQLDIKNIKKVIKEQNEQIKKIKEKIDNVSAKENLNIEEEYAKLNELRAKYKNKGDEVEAQKKLINDTGLTVEELSKYYRLKKELEKKEAQLKKKEDQLERKEENKKILVARNMSPEKFKTLQEEVRKQNILSKLPKMTIKQIKKELTKLNNLSKNFRLRDRFDIRIGHALHFSPDINYFVNLKQFGVVVELCTSSNFSLSNIKDLAKIPYAQYIKHGIPVVVGTDGGGYYLTSLKQEASLINWFFDRRIKKKNSKGNKKPPSSTNNSMFDIFLGEFIGKVSNVQQSEFDNTGLDMDMSIYDYLEDGFKEKSEFGKKYNQAKNKKKLIRDHFIQNFGEDSKSVNTLKREFKDTQAYFVDLISNDIYFDNNELRIISETFDRINEYIANKQFTKAAVVLVSLQGAMNYQIKMEEVLYLMDAYHLDFKKCLTTKEVDKLVIDKVDRDKNNNNNNNNNNPVNSIYEEAINQAPYTKEDPHYQAYRLRTEITKVGEYIKKEAIIPDEKTIAAYKIIEKELLNSYDYEYEWFFDEKYFDIITKTAIGIVCIEDHLNIETELKEIRPFIDNNNYNIDKFIKDYKSELNNNKLR